MKKAIITIFTILTLLSCLTTQSESNGNLKATMQASIDGGEWFSWGGDSGTGLSQITMKLRGTESRSNSSAKIVRYLWDFGDGTTEEGEVVEHTFFHGIWNITLTVFDENGNQSSESLTWNVRGIENTTNNESNLVSIEISKKGNYWDPIINNNVVEGVKSTIYLRVRNTGYSKGTKFDWSIDDGTSNSGDTIKHTFTEGIWNIKCIITSENGKKLEKVVTYEVKKTHLKAVIEGNINNEGWFHWGGDSGTGLSEMTMQFRGTKSENRTGSSIAEYKWDFNDGNTLYGEVIEYTLDKRKWIITLTITTKSGRTDTTTRTWDVRGTR